MDMSIGFPLYANSYLWTRRGLTHLDEIETNDEILGELNGELIWKTFNGIKIFNRKHHSIKLITKSGELVLPDFSIISTYKGYKIMGNITLEDNIFYFDNIKLFKICNIEKKDYKSLIYFKKSKMIEIDITPFVSFFLGKYMFYFNDSDSRRIEIIYNNPSQITSIYNKFVNSFSLNKNEISYFIDEDSNKIIIESNIFNKIRESFSDYPKIPFIIRESPQSVIKNFIIGLFQNSKRKLNISGEQVFFRTRFDEVCIRLFILNILYILGIKPINILNKQYKNNRYIDIFYENDVILKINNHQNIEYNYKIEDIYPKTTKIEEDEEDSFILLNYPKNIINYRLVYNSNLITPIKL